MTPLKRCLAPLLAAAGLAAGAVPASAADSAPVITNQPASQIVFQGSPVTFSVGVDGTAPLFYHWWRGNALIPNATNAAYSISSTSPSDNNSVFLVTVSNSLGQTTSSNATLLIDSGVLVTTTNVLVPIASQAWRYDESGNNYGTAWKEAGYNDSGWPLGLALFGFDIAPEAYPEPFRTPLKPVEAGGPITTYFRTHFQLPSNMVSITLISSNLVDAGVAYWINGGYAGGLRLGTVPPNYLTLADPQLNRGAYEVLNLGATNLVAGDNLLAAELHRSDPSRSEVAFGMSLLAVVTCRVPDTNPPVVARALPSPGSVVRSLTSIEVLFSKAVRGVDASDLLINTVPATGLTYGLPGQFLFDFPQPSPGPVQVSWSLTHGITDLSVTPISFAGTNWSYILITNNPSPKVVINEFLALNSGDTYRDEDGDPSDWIEIYNADTVAVNLGGWFLTDDMGKPTQWRFPSYTMQAKTFLVVFASGKDRTNATGRLHTNFQLNNGGEFLGLLDANTNLVSAFSPVYPVQYKDVSYGRNRLNLDEVGYFALPTPGLTNATSGAGFAPEVASSRASGTFPLNAPFWVTLGSADPTATNVTVYYSLGTNLPGTNTLVYSGPIAITNTTVLRACASVPGLSLGPITTWSYIALDTQTNILRFNSDLPLMILHNYGAGPLTVDKSPRYVVVQTFEPAAGHCSLTNAPSLAEHGEFHLRGSSTLTTTGKGAFALETQDEYGDNKNVPLLGFPDENDWVLYAPNNFEPVLFHNPLAHQLYRDTGHYTSRTRFVEVFLKDDTGSPGPITWADYNGVYVLEEKIKVDKNRVDIDKLAPENSTAPSVTGGYLLSVDRPNGEPQLTAGNLTMNQLDPTGTEMATPERAPQAAYIQTYFNSFYATLNGPNWTNPVTGYAAWVDVDQWINFHIHEVVTFNLDCFRLSGFFYKPRNGKIMQGPCWDYDRTQGSTDSRDFNPFVWHSTVADYGTDFFNPGNTFSNPWYGRMFNDPDFWQRWIDTYQRLRDTVLFHEQRLSVDRLFRQSGAAGAAAGAGPVGGGAALGHLDGGRASATTLRGLSRGR